MGLERTIAIGFAAAVSALACGGAWAADQGFQVQRLDLSRTDTPYPPAARALNLPGRATLSCSAASSGAVWDCKVVGEDPPDWGFGEAAMLSAAAINVGPGEEGRKVQVPVAFRLQPDELSSDPALKAPGFTIPDDQIRWVEQPAVQDFVQTYPSDAVRRDIEGFVVLACRVTPEGRLSPCAVTGEQPLNGGFDKAALALVAKYRMAPRLLDGRPITNGVVRRGLGWSLH